MKPLENTLPYLVECKSTQAFFEIIAAFNVRQAAEAYAAECGEVNRSFEYRVTSPYPEIGYASLIERRIVGRLVTDLLAAGYTIGVNDGEEDVVSTNCIEAEIIFKALASTDADVLLVRKPGTPLKSFVALVWGNDADVISDYGTSLEAVIEPINKMIDELEG